MKTKKHIIFALALGLVAAPFANQARAGGDDFILGALAGCLGLGMLSAAAEAAPRQTVIYQQTAPAVVYQQPAPVVVAPAPVIYQQPAPVVVAPAPVVYRTHTTLVAPARVHYAPPQRPHHRPRPLPPTINGRPPHSHNSTHGPIFKGRR